MSLQDDVAAYWRELNTPCVISTSHYTYGRLVRTYGATPVNDALQPYFDAERAEQAQRNSKR